MSGIYISGMEMPQKGEYECTIRVWSDGTAMLYGNSELVEGGELVPVPEPHGRLIDADALMEKFLETYTEYERKKLLVFYAAEVKQEVADMITDVPTIILAEEGMK